MTKRKFQTLFWAFGDDCFEGIGTNRLRAVVVPDNKKLENIIAANADGQDIRDLEPVIGQIVDAELETRGAEAIKIDPVDRGSAEKVYEIIQ